MIYEITLTYNSTSEVLTLNPENWSTQGVNMARSDVYHGFVRMEYITSFRFPIKSGGGGQFILDAYESEGVEAVINISIKKKIPQTDGYGNERKGILDLKPEKFKIDKKDRFIECSIIDSEKQNKFITRDDINYNVFSLVSTDNVTVTDFATPYREIDFLPIDIYVNALASMDTDQSEIITTIVDYYEFPFTGVSVQVNEIGDRFNVSVGGEDITIYTNDTGDTKNIRINDIEYLSNIDATFTAGAAMLDSGVSFFLCFQIKDSAGDWVKTYYVDYYLKEGGGFTLTPSDPIYSLGALYYDSVVNYDYTVDSFPKNITASQVQTDIDQYAVTTRTGFALSYQDRGMIEFEVEDGGTIELKAQAIKNDPGVNMTLEFDLQYDVSFQLTEIGIGEPQTTVKGMFMHEAFTRLMQLMTSETDTSKLYYSELTGRTDSEFTQAVSNGDAAYDFITNGKLIRSYPDEPLNLNFRNVFLSLDGLRNAGCAFDSTNDRFYIAKKEEFYNSSILFDLGEVANLEITPLKKAYYSKILSGQKNKIEYEEANGANEYNVETEHTLSIPIKETLDIRTPYNTDSVGQELARRKQYSSYAGEDTKYDDKVYIDDTDGSETIQNGSTVTGFAGSDTYYNIAFSPRECLIRWSNWISAALWRSSNKVINFIKSQKNTNVSYTNEGGYSVNEQDNIEELEFLSRIINPEMVSFDKPLTEEMRTDLNTNPHGIIVYSYEGEDYAMFLKELKSEDYKNNASWEGIDVDYAGVVTDTAIFENDNTIQFENGNNLIWSS